MAEQARMADAEKTVGKFKLMWTWGRVTCFAGIGLVIFWLFAASLGSLRDIFGILGNVLLFSGMAVSYYGLRRLTALIHSLHNIPSSTLTCPLCGKAKMVDSAMCPDCMARLSHKFK